MKYGKPHTDSEAHPKSFLERGLIARAQARRSGHYVTAEQVIEKLEEILRQAHARQ
ncbi:hypothetical protein [Pseudazoarcus pumilus]|uniref:hypothetical protein n=1 Tax=Pseudazoarcus pumilus TaxID=2067960 RepID=UPI0013DBD214|nr:hypothetical protein [Pseudazoarcus pumilus]